MGIIGWIKYGSNPKRLLENLEKENKRLVKQRSELEGIRQRNRELNTSLRQFVPLPFEDDIQFINERLRENVKREKKLKEYLGIKQ